MLRLYERFRRSEKEKILTESSRAIHRYNGNPFDSNTLKEVGYYAVSNSISPSVTAGFYFINIIVLSNKSLAASALISTFDNLIINSGCSILSSACTIVSNAYGEKGISPEPAIAKIRCCLKSGIAFALILSGPAVIGALWSKEILRFSQQPEEILNIVQEYFIGYSWGIPAIFVVYIEKQIAIGVADIRSVNILTIFDNLTISLLGYLLVNGKLGFTKMGVSGLGYAYSFTSWFDLIFFSIYLKHGSRFKDYEFDLFSEFKNVSEIFQEISHLGFPIGFQVGVELLIMLCYSTLIGMIGTSALSAYQISVSYLQLAVIPTYGIYQSALFLIGREMGAHKIQNAKKVGTVCITLGAGVTLVLLGLTSCMTKQLIKPFINIEDPQNEEIVMNARILLILNGVAQVFDSIKLIASGSIQAAFKDTKVAMVSGIVSLGLIGLPLGYMLGFPAKLGVVGLCTGRGIGLILGSCSLLAYWLKEIKNTLLSTTVIPISEMDSSNHITTATDENSFLSLEKNTLLMKHLPPKKPILFSSFIKAGNEDLIEVKSKRSKCTVC